MKEWADEVEQDFYEAMTLEKEWIPTKEQQQDALNAIKAERNREYLEEAREGHDEGEESKQ